MHNLKGQHLRNMLGAGALALACVFPAHAVDGVTATEIKLGQTAATSGVAAALTGEFNQGARAMFESVNRAGGVNGRSISIKTLNDEFKPEPAAANTKKLIEEDKVFALFGYRGTAGTTASLPIFTAAKVPVVGTTSGVWPLRQPVPPYLFHVRASTIDEVETAVRQVTNQGIVRIAIAYQDDGYGKEALSALESSMKSRNLKIAVAAPVPRNTDDVAGAAKAVAASNAQAVVMAMQAKPAAKFVAEARKSGASMQFIALSVAGGLYADLGAGAEGVLVVQVTPTPFVATAAPIVKEYQEAMKKIDAKGFSYGSMEGYIAAKALVRGLTKAGKDLTREKFIAAMETMKGEDLGGFTLNYGPDNHNGSGFVDITMLRKDGSFAR
jgi:ABC-type branched-subunit amino acid transport system substrate-binding protein